MYGFTNLLMGIFGVSVGAVVFFFGAPTDNWLLGLFMLLAGGVLLRRGVRQIEE